jgi:membrane protease YdiL (CAAX protease family)
VSPRQLGGAVAIAAGLPLALVAARAVGIGIMLQGAILVAWAIVGPALLERGLGPLPSVRAIGGRAATTGQAVLVGLAATLGLTHVAHYGLGAVAYASQCVEPGAEHGLARRLLDAESVEVTRSLEGAHAKWAYVAMSVLVVPIAEERVFRDVLQRALALRFGKLRGLGGASALFGLAHLGVYRAAMAQAALLGVGFGMAYEEGGLLAATLTHALWNLYLLG